MTGMDDLVPVMVPRPYVTRVYGFIAELDGERTTPAPEAPPTPATEGAWTPALVRRMFNDSSESAKAVLKHLAARPDERVTAPELVKALPEPESGRPADETTLYGVLGAVGHRVSRRYGMRASDGTAIMPYRNIWDHGLRETVYVMSSDIAEVIAGL